MRRKLITVLLLFFVAGYSYAQRPGKSATVDYEQLIRQTITAAEQGDYATAKKGFLVLIPLIEDLFEYPKEEERELYFNLYSMLISSYAQTLIGLKDYGLARSMLQHSEEYISEKLSQNPNDLRSIEVLYGQLSLNVYDNDEALNHFSKAKQMYNLAGDDGALYHLQVLIPLCGIYMSMGDYAFAKLIVDEMDDFVREKKFMDFYQSLREQTNQEFEDLKEEDLKEEEQAELATLSLMYYQLGYRDKSMEILDSVFTQYGKNRMGMYWDGLRNLLAIMLMDKGEIQRAKELCRITWEIGTYGLEIALSQLVKCCTAESSIETLGYLQQLNRLTKRNISATLSNVRAMERQTYWETEIDVLARANYNALYAFHEKAEVCEQAYDIALYAKSMQDKALHETATWKDVKKTLSKNEVAIEFVICETNVTGKNPQNRIGALILNKDMKSPRYVDLCSEDDVNFLEFANHTDTAKINKFYAVGNTTLYDYIWQKIIPFLKDDAVIYYSPISFLTHLNLEVLGDGQLRMNQRYTLHQVSTTAAIREVKALKWQKRGDAVIYGGLIYDESVEEMQAAAKDYRPIPGDEMLAMRSIYQEDADSRGAINILSGTLEEAEFIRDILTKNGSKVTLFTEEQGNEESIKALSGHAPYTLHIATHGFFLSTRFDYYQHRSIVDQLDVMNNRQQSWLLYSGLLMSGSYNAWYRRMIPDGMEDGILTSYELSQIDLRGCRLAVLSACETGLGILNGYAGDLGLRHALKLAGVQTVIASLWQVPDNATAILMKTFYERISLGMEPSKALLEAQEAVRAKFPQAYYWAAFHLID